jgi:hypothetical protein
MVNKVDPVHPKFVQQDSLHPEPFPQIQSLDLPLTTAAVVVVGWETTIRMLELPTLVLQVAELRVDVDQTINSQLMV